MKSGGSLGLSQGFGHRLLYPNLSVFDLSHNDLRTLPSDISAMKKLTELKIKDNKIVEVSVRLVSFR